MKRKQWKEQEIPVFKRKTPLMRQQRIHGDQPWRGRSNPSDGALRRTRLIPCKCKGKSNVFDYTMVDYSKRKYTMFGQDRVYLTAPLKRG